MNSFLKYIKEPWRIIVAFDRHICSIVPDKLYLKCYYRIAMGKKLDLKNPKTYNEKLQWLKLYDRKPIYSTMVDKYEAKKYVASIIGEEYIIPTLGVWNTFDEIDFNALPRQFVLKCTHSSGDVIICKDKSEFDIEDAKAKINASLKKKHYKFAREWPYKNVKPRIIAEKYMEDAATEELRDYKFFCFDGKVKSMFIASDRQSQNQETKFDFFDENYNHLEIKNGHPNSDVLPLKPNDFDRMKVLACELSKGMPQIRVDFYEINQKIYFGELTIFHGAGYLKFEPEKWDEIFGSWVKLPDKKCI